VSESRPKLRPKAIWAGILIVVARLGILVFFAWRWLVIQDPLVPRDAIVVLSGHIRTRARSGTDLSPGRAEQIWSSNPSSPAEVLTT